MGRGIEKLHPELIPICINFMDECEKSGLNVLITETFRTVEEQNELYSKGRTKPGSIVTNCKGTDYQSPHQWGVAFDFCRNEKGREFDDSDGFFRKCGTVGKNLGLFWGGDFRSYYDGPHLEFPKFLPSNSTSTLKRQYATPEKFMATWGSQIVLDIPPILKIGSTGDAVKKLQSLLSNAGYPLAADGHFGSLTENAVKLFQTNRGLLPDGIVGTLTWTELEKIENKNIDTIADAIDKLHSLDIINSPNYWKENYSSTLWLDTLLVKIANRL